MSEFIRHLEKASATVATWPEWKRNVLGGRREAVVSEVCEQCGGTGKERDNYIENGRYIFRKIVCAKCNGGGRDAVVSDVDKDADEGCPLNKIYCEHGRMSCACTMCEIEAERDMLRRQVAEKERQVDALIHLYGAILTCYQCGMMGGPKIDGNCGPDRLGVPDVCEEQLERWSLEQAKKGGGGE
jgi:hypothetical protein